MKNIDKNIGCIDNANDLKKRFEEKFGRKRLSQRNGKLLAITTLVVIIVLGIIIFSS